MTTLHFNEAPSRITNFWARGSSLPILSVMYLMSQLSPEDAIKFCSKWNLLATLIWPWNGEFITKLNAKPLHKFPTIAFPVLTLAGFLAD